MKCLRCDIEMEYNGQEKIQLGETGFFLGDLPNLLAGALEVQIYSCPKCGKIEFFKADDSLTECSQTEDRLPQTQCPNCGKMHDFDYPKCPYCKHDYYGKE